jgi:hypothetical protein
VSGRAGGRAGVKKRHIAAVVTGNTLEFYDFVTLLQELVTTPTINAETAEFAERPGTR